MTATIRPARANDADALGALKLATFRTTFVDADGFAIPYPAADCALFEEASFAPARIAHELADPARRQWVAEAGGRLVGYAHVGPCKLPHPEVKPGAGEIYQLYLTRQAQGAGLGARLLDTSLAYLAGARPGPVWLGVWCGNLRAQALYARYGFDRVGEYQFPVGAWRDDEFILRRD